VVLRGQVVARLDFQRRDDAARALVLRLGGGELALLGAAQTVECVERGDGLAGKDVRGVRALESIAALDESPTLGRRSSTRRPSRTRCATGSRGRQSATSRSAAASAGAVSVTAAAPGQGDGEAGWASLHPYRQRDREIFALRLRRAPSAA